MKGIDLPKIYLGDIVGTDDVYIIDGGHRSRAIMEYMANMFSIPLIDGSQTYYNKKFEKLTRGKSILTKEQKKQFDGYHVDIVEYFDINEEKCRDIFNKLQNAKPMSIEDVINSWQSDLVDYLRDTVNTLVNGTEISTHFVNLHIIPKPHRTSIMSQLLSWYTILFPNMSNVVDIEDIEVISLKYLTKGNSNSSPSLEYIRMNNDEITDEMKTKFINLVTYIISYYQTKKDQHKDKIPTSDMNTLIHSIINFTNFNVKKYETLLSKVKEYDILKKKAADNLKNKKYDEGKLDDQSADELNESYDSDLEPWFKSRNSGGNNPSGMTKRMNIMKSHCLD